jgi:tetratricopeptide (TPR) repeat protein
VKWYAPALVWMAKYAAKNEELLRFRAEAASCLGVPETLSAEQELAKADDVKFYTLVLEARPKAAWAYGARGSAYAERGQWKEAAAEFTKAAETKEGDPLLCYYQALLRLQVADVEGYRKLCTDMLGDSSSAAKTGAPHWAIAWTCALAGDAVVDWRGPLQLAEKDVAGNSKNYRALNQYGAVLYRAGRYEESLKRLTEAGAAYRTDDEKTAAIAYNWLFLAMAHHRLGHVEEARKWHDKAFARIDQEPGKKPEEPAVATSLPWNRRLTLQLLRREAEELLKTKNGM